MPTFTLHYYPTHPSEVLVYSAANRSLTPGLYRYSPLQTGLYRQLSTDSSLQVFPRLQPHLISSTPVKLHNVKLHKRKLHANSTNANSTCPTPPAKVHTCQTSVTCDPLPRPRLQLASPPSLGAKHLRLDHVTQASLNPAPGYLHVPIARAAPYLPLSGPFADRSDLRKCGAFRHCAHVCLTVG